MIILSLEIRSELIERASKNLFIKVHLNQPHHSISSQHSSFNPATFSDVMIKHMIRARKGQQAGLKDVFELLEIEKEEALTNYRKKHGIS